MESPAHSVSVVLPTYNEAGNIIDLIAQIGDVLSDHSLEIIVVDDDSPDGTWRRVEEVACTTPSVHLIRRMGRRGLCSALREGILASTGRIVCWMDCDFSMPPAALRALVAEVASGTDLAIGSRYVAGGRDGRSQVAWRRAASVAITRLARRLLVPGLRDYTSGFVAARRELLERIPLRGDHGEYCIELVFRAHRLGYKLVEVPYVLSDRRHGESKTEQGFLSKGARYLGLIIRLHLERRPRAR